MSTITADATGLPSIQPAATTAASTANGAPYPAIGTEIDKCIYAGVCTAPNGSPLTTWLLAAAIAALVGLAWTLDAQPTELEAAQDIAADHLSAAQATALAQRRRERFAAAAAQLCGSENATWSELPDGAIQCRTKRGHITHVAQVRP